MNKKIERSKTTRRPYRKPQLEKVGLVPEEAVLSACKVAQGPGPGTGRCNRPMPGCYTIGS